MVHILLGPAWTPLYLCVSTFRSMCAVPNVAVFCSSLTSWFPGMLLTYFRNDFKMVSVAPLITGITFVFTLLLLLLLLLLYFVLVCKKFYLNYLNVLIFVIYCTLVIAWRGCRFVFNPHPHTT